MPRTLSPASNTSAPPTTHTVRALIFYSGEHIDGAGTKRTYTTEDIEAMVVASNALRASGRRIKFYLDHEGTQSQVIGHISGQFTTETITGETVLPFDSETLREELDGELGLFADITLSGTDIVGQYHDGRLKEISAGIDLAGEMGHPGAIVEVSAVGIQSLAGAGLYALSLREAITERENKRRQPGAGWCGNLQSSLEQSTVE